MLTPESPAPAETTDALRVVVTRNYKQTTDAKYITRPLDSATVEEIANFMLTEATMEITSKDKRFEVEKDFGCGLVIVGTLGQLTAEEKVPGSAHKIVFDGVAFCDVANRKAVWRADAIYFTPDGIFALCPK